RAYYGKMERRYAGSRVLALAAYNAGPGRVDEWIAEHGDPRSGRITEAEWARSIPFDETRNYVRKVERRLAPSVQGPDTAATREVQAYVSRQADAYRDSLAREFA